MKSRIKNKRWREYVKDILNWSDPWDGRLIKQQNAFKAGYNKGVQDALLGAINYD